DPVHQRHAVLGVAEGRVTGLLLLHDGHGDFGEVVHHEVVDRAARHLAVRRLEPVAPEALARRDAHGGRRAPSPGIHSRITSRRTASAPSPAPRCTRSSMSGAKPSGREGTGGSWGRASSERRGRGRTARPPGGTVISCSSPTVRGRASRNRRCTVARHGCAPLSRAKPGYSSTVSGSPRSVVGTTKLCRPNAC